MQCEMILIFFTSYLITKFLLVCQVGRPRRSSGIPRSRGSSREASPSSHHRYGGRIQSQLRASAERTLPKRPLLTENILKQSREAESALADALVSLYLLYCTQHNKNMIPTASKPWSQFSNRVQKILLFLLSVTSLFYLFYHQKVSKKDHFNLKQPNW